MNTAPNTNNIFNTEQRDLVLEGCVQSALEDQDQLTLDIYFAFGGAKDKINSISKQILNSNSQNLNWTRFDNISSKNLEKLIIQQFFLKPEADFVQTLPFFVKLAPTLKKVAKQFNNSFEPQKRDLAEKLACILSYRVKLGGLSQQTLQDEMKAFGDSIANNKGEVLKQVIEKGDLDLLKLLMQFPKDLEAKDADGNTPLINAILSENEEIVKFLIDEKGANIEALGQNKATPLMMACYTNNLPFVTYLLDKKANLNAKDVYGSMPLHYAAGSFKILELILSRGAQDISDSKGYRAIHWALMRRGPKLDAILNLLLPLEKHPLLPSFFIYEKMICHRFGSKRTFENKDGLEISLEGFTREFAFKEMQESLHDYISKFPPDPNLPQDFWLQVSKTMSTLLSNTQNLHSALSKWNPDDIIPLMLGWQGHTTGLAISKRNNLLLKCNRGNGCGEKPGIEVFEIGDKSKLKNVLKSAVSYLPSKLGMKYLVDELNQELRLLRVAHLKHKEQSIGNCTWASIKMLLRGVIYLTLLTTKGYEQNAESLSLKSYKDWSQADRQMALQKFKVFLDELETNFSPEMIFSDEMRQEGIIPYEILGNVFLKCLREHRLESLKFLIEGFPNILEIVDRIRAKNPKAIPLNSAHVKNALKCNQIHLAFWIANRVQDGREEAITQLAQTYKSEDLIEAGKKAVKNFSREEDRIAFLTELGFIQKTESKSTAIVDDWLWT